MANKEFESDFASKGGVALIKGPYEQVMQQSSELLEDLDSEDYILIDASELAGILSVNRHAEVSEERIFAPVTAFQLKQFVNEELENLIEETACRLIIVSSMRNLFFDPNLNDKEYTKLFSEVLSKFREIASEHGIFVVALDFVEVYGNGRDAKLSKLLEIASDWVVQASEPEVSLLEVEKCIAA